jgi:hypothetical protein
MDPLPTETDPLPHHLKYATPSAEIVYNMRV